MKILRAEYAQSISYTMCITGAGSFYLTPETSQTSPRRELLTSYMKETATGDPREQAITVLQKLINDCGTSSMVQALTSGDNASFSGDARSHTLDSQFLPISSSAPASFPE